MLLATGAACAGTWSRWSGCLWHSTASPRPPRRRRAHTCGGQARQGSQHMRQPACERVRVGAPATGPAAATGHCGTRGTRRGAAKGRAWKGAPAAPRREARALLYPLPQAGDGRILALQHGLQLYERLALGDDHLPLLGGLQQGGLQPPTHTRRAPAHGQPPHMSRLGGTQERPQGQGLRGEGRRRSGWRAAAYLGVLHLRMQLLYVAVQLLQLSVVRLLRGGARACTQSWHARAPNSKQQRTVTDTRMTPRAPHARLAPRAGTRRCATNLCPPSAPTAPPSAPPRWRSGQPPWLPPPQPRPLPRHAALAAPPPPPARGPGLAACACAPPAASPAPSRSSRDGSHNGGSECREGGMARAGGAAWRCHQAVQARRLPAFPGAALLPAVPA
jgi:hypothetical protein